jgi:hypothetical protein
MFVLDYCWYCYSILTRPGKAQTMPFKELILCRVKSDNRQEVSMSLTQLAVIVLAGLVILQALTVVSTTLALVLGIVAVVLVLLETPVLAGVRRP